MQWIVTIGGVLYQRNKLIGASFLNSRHIIYGTIIGALLGLGVGMIVDNIIICVPIGLIAGAGIGVATSLLERRADGEPLDR